MSDAKQPIYDALNWMASSIPPAKPDSSGLVIDAYEKACMIEDNETRKLFLDVIKQLRLRESSIGKVVDAWAHSSGRLRTACQLIEGSTQ